jgi:hypothetical protein
MPTFRIHLKTVLAVAATGADLSSTVSVVHAAGGTDVSVFQNDEHGRAEFSLQAGDRNQGFLSAARLLSAAGSLCRSRNATGAKCKIARPDSQLRATLS